MLNQYDWRQSVEYEDVKDHKIIEALDKLSTVTLQWIHLILHDREGGGYIPSDMPKETIHDAIAVILDHRGAYHSPEFLPSEFSYNRPWN